MRILNQSFQTTSSAKKVERKSSEAPQTTNPQTALMNDSERKIVKRERPDKLSDSQIRSKIEEIRLAKENKVKPVIKDTLVTAMPDDVEIANKSSIIHKNDGTDVKKPKPAAPAIEEAQDLKMKNIKKDLTLKSDVDSNDPNDTNVQEKLKSILKTGAFNFSQKEKEALGQILSK